MGETNRRTDKPTTTLDGDKAIFRVHIRGTMEAVFRELTKTDEIQVAMFNCVMHRTGDSAGSAVQMRTPDNKYTAVVGEVLDYDPPRRFSHTMRFTQYDDPDCTVVYDLEPADGGVDFTLTIKRMPLGTKTAKSMLQGGPMICRVLKSVVETGKAPLDYRVLGVVFKLIGMFATPKKCRVERWPLGNG